MKNSHHDNDLDRPHILSQAEIRNLLSVRIKSNLATVDDDGNEPRFLSGGIKMSPSDSIVIATSTSHITKSISFSSPQNLQVLEAFTNPFFALT